MRVRECPRRVWPLFLVLFLVAAGCAREAAKKPAAEGKLIGLFRITAGECAGAGVTKGTYFRMVNVGGTLENGPFVANTDSPCGDKTWTPMRPGTDGGLLTGVLQPHPDPAFDKDRNATAGRITTPTKWFGSAYSLTTNGKDPQTGVDAQAPSITASAGKLSGDLRAFAAAWNGQHFNQGSPKPDGTKPGKTSGPSGTYDASTNAFTLEWTSQIVEGPFNNFTGTWHFEGTFEPKASAAPASDRRLTPGLIIVGFTLSSAPVASRRLSATVLRNLRKSLTSSAVRFLLHRG